MSNKERLADVEPPEMPEPAEAGEADDPLFSTDMDFDEATERLRAYRRYESVDGDNDNGDDDDDEE